MRRINGNRIYVPNANCCPNERQRKRAQHDRPPFSLILLQACVGKLWPVLLAISLAAPGRADISALKAAADVRIQAVTERVVRWRRDIHQHPELGNQEFRTAALVAAHLESLGLVVETGVGGTGVVANLRGAQAGPVLALRADMDALPVREAVDLPFASRASALWRGERVDVMHACGHDNHTAILMGVAEVLTGLAPQLAGSVRFIFQPAEEGVPGATVAGAELMRNEGVLDGVDAVIGLHVGAAPLGSIGYRSGPLMASADGFEIVVRGTATHAAAPWTGVDPIIVGAQIVLGLQQITSRQVDVTRAPAVISVGRFAGGTRGNIIPQAVELWGTIRSFDENMRGDIHRRVQQTATHIAAASGAAATVEISRGTPVLVNNVTLTSLFVPTLQEVARDGLAGVVDPTTTAEDFAFFAERVPGFYFFLGVADPSDPDPAPNHSPLFRADERALPIGMRALGWLVIDYFAAVGSARTADSKSAANVRN